MEIVKVLHTGDLHLGKITGGLTERQKEREREYLRTFHNIITMCLEQNVEIMLVAGDLFDCDDPQDELINDVIHEFLRIQDTVIMIAPGNHDYYRPGTYYDKISTKCENVLIFDGKMDFYEMKIHGKEVRIYGAGFTKPVVSERLMQQREIIEDTMITLAVFHGDIISGNQQSYYGPLNTEWIRQNGFDDLALGHIHKQTDVIHTGHSNYAYCGCPEGFGFGEQGVRGVYVGEVGHGYQNMQYVRTCKRMYLTYTLNLDRLKDSTLTSRQVAEFICNDLESIYGIEYIENYYRIEITGQ